MKTTPWADVVTLGNARFGRLAGGPFDGRCYPLIGGTPTELRVPAGEADASGPPGSLRYVLTGGVYRFVDEEAGVSAA